MKLSSLVTALKATLHRLRYVLLFSLLGFALAAGGAYGWKVYQHRQGPEFVIEQLNKALLAGKKADVASLVDFRTLSVDFAHNLYLYRPNTPRVGVGEQAVLHMADLIQQALFQALEPPKDDKPIVVTPDSPLSPLPVDFFHQIAGRFSLQSPRAGVVLAKVMVDYSRIQKKFPLLLIMESKGQGWRITKIANSPELIKIFTESEIALHTQRAEALAEKNASEQARMDAQLEIQSCTAAAGMLSDRKTTMLTVQVIGRNKGPHTIHNMNLLATLTGQNLKTVRHINIAARMPPGENLSHTYNVELQLDKAEDADLARAGKLQCIVKPRAMTLSSGEVLFLREPTNP